MKMICEVLVVDDSVDGGRREDVVFLAASIGADDSGALVVKGDGHIRGVIYAPGTWLTATLKDLDK